MFNGTDFNTLHSVANLKILQNYQFRFEKLFSIIEGNIENTPEKKSKSRISIVHSIHIMDFKLFKKPTPVYHQLKFESSII